MSATVFAETGYPVTTRHLLEVDFYASTSCTLRINYIIERPDEQETLRLNQTVYISVANRQAELVSIVLQNGFLTGVSIVNDSSTPQLVRGQCWTHARLRSLTELTGNKLIPLIEGYVSYKQSLVWPPARFDQMTTLPGWLSSVNMSPAAGADISKTVPSNARWRIGSIRATLVTSTQVATRTPKFSITDGTNVLYEVVPGGGTALNVTASQTRTFLLIPGYSVVETAYDNNNEVRVILPLELTKAMQAGWKITSATTNIQTADAWTAYASVEELFEITA